MKKVFLVLVIALLAAGAAFAQSQAVVNVDALNVRKGPGANYALAGQLTKGTRVQVLDSSGQWWKIKSDNIEGYVNSDYLTVSGSNSSSSTSSSPSSSKSSSAKKTARVNNWFSGEVSILGAGARYERMLNDKMSIGGNVYYNWWFWLWDEFEVGGSFRFYPWGGTGKPVEGLFFGSGLGFHIRYGFYDDYYDDDYYWGIWDDWWGPLYGVAISPEVGWKLDVGGKGGFFLEPGIKIPITLGAHDTWDGKSKFGAGVGVVAYFGLGFSI